eukprot:CAMPEP_0113935702 /NCGR_PEP_ID=MMETSP1339-20121228/2806_1 /TAXON_ID=94617 /ORGANISM="Fibrocapsa japonica" /LENGTH=299 /DNA_ID=CAMNT_0000937943 /DNA_START=96 /DNA_END=995 /DNA_ORIENTATION=+ /assembly_acc=CAM_ASM_000762
MDQTTDSVKEPLNPGAHTTSYVKGYETGSDVQGAIPSDKEIPYQAYGDDIECGNDAAIAQAIADDIERGDASTVAQSPAFSQDKLDAIHRQGFIRKVYGILSFQLLLTTGISALFMLYQPVLVWVLTNTWMYWVTLALSLVVLCALFCNKDKYPTNFYLLIAFTLCMSYGVGLICAAYQASGKGMIVLEALGLTLTVFLVLTLFTMQSKWDFSFMAAGLYCCLCILMIWGIVVAIWHVGEFMYAVFGAILFSLYIIFDTWLITKKLSYDDYILGAINLYLDIINLFLFILQLLGGGGGD